MTFPEFLNEVYALTKDGAFYLYPSFTQEEHHTGRESAINTCEYKWDLATDVDPELDVLDIILERFWPNISLLQYKNLCREIVEHGSHHRSQYYSEGYQEGYKKFRYRDLYQALANRGLLDG